MSSKNIANESGDSPSISSPIYFDKENPNISNMDISEMVQPVGNQLINIHNEFDTVSIDNEVAKTSESSLKTSKGDKDLILASDQGISGIEQRCGIFSNKSADDLKESEVFTYSTELSEYVKETQDVYTKNVSCDYNKTSLTENASCQTKDKAESRRLINIDGGTFGPALHPPRPSANFCRLDVSTDLNLPPPNWLNVDPSSLPPGLAGFNATPHYSGFSSFRMASLFLDYSSKQR